MHGLSTSGFILSGLCLLCLAGCVEIRQTIELNEDGSGRLIEVVRFDDRLVQASKSMPELSTLSDFLKIERAKERMEYLGEVTLVSHEVKDLGGRGWEAKTVFAFKDINKLVLPAMPHRGANWTGQKMMFRLGEPIVVHEAWRNAYYTRKPLTISFTPKTEETPAVENALPPAEKEKLQVLLPVIRAMLEGFRMTVKLEAFGPVEGQSKTHVIFDVKAEDLQDDDTLMKVIEWNRFPDKYLAATGYIGGAGGHVRNEGYTIAIALPYTPEPSKRPRSR